MDDFRSSQTADSHTAGPRAKGRLAATIADPMDSIRRAFAAARHRKWLAIGVFLSALALVLAYGFTRTKLYTATSGMVVNSRELNVSEKDKEVLPGLSTADTAVATEVEIMRSSAVALGTVRALNLVDNPVFAASIAKLPATARETAATGMVIGGTKIIRPGESSVVSIAYTTSDPTLAKAVADQIGHQYLAVKEKSRRAAVEQVGRGLGNELDNLRIQLEAADTEVARYRAQHDLFDSQGATFTQQELSLYKQQQAAAQAALADAQAKLSTARGQTRKGDTGGVGAVLQSPVIQQLRNQRALLATTYADMQGRYQPDHPDLIRTKDQVEALDRAISAETSRQLANLNANAQIARDQVANAAGIVARTTGTLASDNNASVQLSQLQRKADGLRSTYQALLERKNLISSQALVADEDARIFSPAAFPQRPTSPNKPLILMIGLVLATIVAGAAVWIAEAFDRKLNSSADIERKLGLPHIANVPEISSIARPGEEGISAIDFPVERPLSLYAEQLRAVRLALVRKGRNAMTSVGITSARPSEGKTTLAISLARTSAMAGSRTLLVDADLRRASVSRAMGLPPHAGLVQVLRRTATLDEALIHDAVSGMYVLPAGDTTENRQDLFAAANIGALLAEAEKRFDLVIFDAAPALAVTDARLLLRQVDEVLMALRWNDTPSQTAAATLKRMRALDIEPLGVIATRVDMRALAAFGHGDVDRDHADYGAYYA
ncbi:polysaccharide biosynthesis tyrosine autokinase [Sphingomonas sp. CFBP 13603]|uniref:GumC family protein n=1 Tax=Sphingomonas sp. CFBP 13603 TaxID=2774040 RepID=UPI0018695614|nr:polysaccharide biosynthesis tyrosine autokinase [Sphingomonas sp. CFBP 13603]MBE2991403.1 polysaccharide biosynthesis tyrosine autokinase [Sphingomonas sp. CFBP 13603]